MVDPISNTYNLCSIFSIIMFSIFRLRLISSHYWTKRFALIFYRNYFSRYLTSTSFSVNEYDDEKYKSDLINQCHINAQIADKKFKWIQRSMICLFISAIPWALAIFILYSERI